MAPGNNGRQPNHTGTIPKTKVRNNSNVPQEAVTPTRRDMTTNLVSTSLDWVPVSEYNTRSNYNQSRKPTNNTSDHELTDIDNTVSFESGFGRFVQVRPQPRALPLNVQNRDNLLDHHDDGAGSSLSGHSLHPYAHQMQNGLIPHSNHAAAAVMIVNPTTPNAVGNISQPFNAPNQNRNNLRRNLNQALNNFEGGSHASNNNSAAPISNSRTGTKTVNLMNNMYEQGQSGTFNNINDNNHVHRESARALGDAIVAACPDAVAVERRLGQIREYIRVTSSLVDTMRNSEDEAFIEHTKEEYDGLIQMVMQLKESESKLEGILAERKPDNIEVPNEENEESANPNESGIEITEVPVDMQDKASIKSNEACGMINNNLKKVTNIENEQLNKTMHNIKTEEDNQSQDQIKLHEGAIENVPTILIEASNDKVIAEASNTGSKDDDDPNAKLRKNILSCVEKVSRIEEMKHSKESILSDDQDVVTRPVSVQSNGSAYSDNELWQNEIKNKMEMSQMRLAALKQQQKRLIKYQEETKQQLDEMNRERDRQSQEIQPSTSHENYSGIQNQGNGSYPQSSRMYAANQIGVATTLPHAGAGATDAAPLVQHAYTHSQGNIASGEEAAGEGNSDVEENEVELSARGHLLQARLRDLHMKKQHMEDMVSEFQKLQMASRIGSTHNTYSSSGEDSGDDEPTPCGNIKNEDPFKLMEIKAIKTALQKTKDLMRSVENYETEQLSGAHDDSFREMSSHSNIHDNKSEGGSVGGWSNDGSVCRVRNSLPQRHKFTNEQHQMHLQQEMQQMHQQMQQNHMHQNQQMQQNQQMHQNQQMQQNQMHQNQQMQQNQQQMQSQNQQLQQLQQSQNQQMQQLQQNQMPSHQMLHNPQQSQQSPAEAKIVSLQELAQELRMETEKIMNERARIKDVLSNKEACRKHKKVNQEGPRAGPSGTPGPAERRQMQLRAILADKQRELEALLNKQQALGSAQEPQHKPESQPPSVGNRSYNSEQEEPDSSEQLLLDAQNAIDIENFRASSDAALVGRSIPPLPAHIASNYATDSDSGSRNKANQRNRPRRRQTQERVMEDNAGQSNANQNIRHEPRPEMTNVNTVPPISQHPENSGNMPYPHLPPPCWNTKSNQDMRTNQFTQNSHSQTMERLLGTPQMSFPPSMPFNMMMPYGVVGACGCGCAVWGAWCWQQLLLQQRDLHQLREQLNHLEERWRAETASHTLNNRVPPGNRANNYWDNFRSYSRQNLLSATSKVNAEAGCAARAPAAAAAARGAGKRNTDEARRAAACERSLSLCSAPDVLNVNQPDEPPPPPNLNLHRPEPSHSRNLNISNPIPEIIQSHSNLDASEAKRKSSSKLPAKNSPERRSCALDYSPTSNINIASATTSEAPNPNLASAGREPRDKAASKLFHLLKENVYSEVTALIGVNESHPDFLIQLFRELQMISSDALRQKVLQSIRYILSQYGSALESRSRSEPEESRPERSSTSAENDDYNDCDSLPAQTLDAGEANQIDHRIVHFLLMKSDEYCTSESLDALAAQILSGVAPDGRHPPHLRRRLLDFLAKYEGMRVCQISSDLIENLPLLLSANEESEQAAPDSDLPESAMLQDVAGSLNLYRAGAAELHQMTACAYDMWPAHDDRAAGDSAHSSQDGKVDLINCTEMQNGDLAEADQTCPAAAADAGAADAAPDALPDVVDTDEVTPTEAEAEWLGLDRVPTRLHMEQSSEKQKD